MLTGILHPSAGEARVDGLVPWRERMELSRRIGCVFGQRSQLWYHLPPANSAREPSWPGCSPDRPPVSLPALALVLPAVYAGALRNFCLLALIALAAFWVEDNEPFFWIHNKFLLILGGVLIPVDFFPGWLNSFAAALPFTDIFYGPARLFVRFEAETALHLFATQAAWCAALALLLALVYRCGVKRVNLNGG